MNNGWIKLHRGLLDWEWYDDSNTCRLFIHCLLRANHGDKTWRGKHIKRGSFFTSLESLSVETGLSARQIRTSLDKLSSTNELTSSSQARGRMITVVKYDSYQSDDRLEGSELTGKCQADDRVATTNKNEKNVNNERNPISDSFLELVSSSWNDTMGGWSPKIDLTKKTQVNKKRLAAIKRIINDYPDYKDHEYWDGHIYQLSKLPDLEWQRNNKQLTFDQAVQIDKFDRNIGFMRMANQ